jgi:hypothetical protein
MSADFNYWDALSPVLDWRVKRFHQREWAEFFTGPPHYKVVVIEPAVRDAVIKAMPKGKQ